MRYVLASAHRSREGGISERSQDIREEYREQMGRGIETGRSLPETLTKLSLEELVGQDE